MFIKMLCGLVLLSSAICKPHFVELDDEEKQLYRAAYDTSYDDDDDVDLDVGVLTPKDSMWLVKAKLKEVKEFMRALSANLLSTKLKMKELVSKHKLHFHKHVDKKPTYSYPSYQHHPPSYEPQPQQYGHEGHYNY